MNGTDIIKGLVLLGAGAVVLMLVLWLLSAVLDEALEQAKRTLKSLQGKPYVSRSREKLARSALRKANEDVMHCRTELLLADAAFDDARLSGDAVVIDLARAHRRAVAESHTAAVATQRAASETMEAFLASRLFGH